MKTLTIQNLHELRLIIFDNAQDLYKEACVLNDHAMYSRSYLLAHFCIEELGKLPIIVGVIAKLTNEENIDWKKVGKRFRSHMEKIGSQNGHYYTFALDADPLRDSDLEWLLSANKKIPETYRKKNFSTYVDVVNGKVLAPQKEISALDTEDILKFASVSLQAHKRSEGLINPLIYKSGVEGQEE